MEDDNGTRPAPRERTATRLDRDVWAMAAVTALAEGGLAAVAVEPIAARLGATKGSFYWHFENRDALLAAAVELWERLGTEQVIAELEQLADPAERLRRLFDRVFRLGDQGRTDLALLAHADHPLVAPALARVTARRVGYLARLFGELGFRDDEARHWGLLAYTTYSGLAQAQRSAPGDLFADDAARDRYVDFVFDLLPVSPAGPGPRR
jgi:AcrR family transcriptional regulator